MGRRPIERSELRAEGHRLLDALWRGRERVGEQSFRSVCYAWLAAKLGAPSHEAHFSRMNDIQLIRAVIVLRGASYRKVRRWWASQRRRSRNNQDA